MDLLNTYWTGAVVLSLLGQAMVILAARPSGPRAWYWVLWALAVLPVLFFAVVTSGLVLSALVLGFTAVVTLVVFAAGRSWRRARHWAAWTLASLVGAGPVTLILFVALWRADPKCDCLDPLDFAVATLTTAIWCGLSIRSFIRLLRLGRPKRNGIIVDS